MNPNAPFDLAAVSQWAYNWLPAISTTAIGGFILFVSRTAFKAEIEKSISSKYDREIEKLKSELKMSEEYLKAEIKGRDDQINALRSGALSNLASRQAALSQRRIAAIEMLWSCTVEQNKLKLVGLYAGILKLDVIAREISSGGRNAQKLKEYMEILWKSMNLDDYKTLDKAVNDRPFIPAQIWALYIARSYILSASFGRFAVVKNGLDPSEMIDDSKVLETTKSVLPHQSEYIDKYGVSGLYRLVEEIEQKLLDAIIAFLNGEDADASGLLHAHAIIKKANEMSAPQMRGPVLAADLEAFSNEPPPPPPAQRG